MMVYVWASGEIERGDILPKGAICICESLTQKINDRIDARCRYAYSGQQLVPGVPEAKNQSEALNALISFQKMIAKNEFEEVA